MVLIVDNDHSVHRAYSHHFEQHWAVRHAYTCQQACDAIRVIDNLRLALVDVDLPDSSYRDSNNARGGFEVIRCARAKFARAITITFSAHVSAWIINTGSLLGAEFMAKEHCAGNFSLLAQRLLALQYTDLTTATLVAELGRGFRLTHREIEVITLAAEDCDREEIAGRLGIALGTVKNHTSNILRKCGAATLREVGRAIRRR